VTTSHLPSPGLSLDSQPMQQVSQMTLQPRPQQQQQQQSMTLPPYQSPTIPGQIGAAMPGSAATSLSGFSHFL